MFDGVLPSFSKGVTWCCVTGINQLMLQRSGCTVRFDTRPRPLLSDCSLSRMALKVWDRFSTPLSLCWSSWVSISCSPLSVLQRPDWSSSTQITYSFQFKIWFSVLQLSNMTFSECFFFFFFFFGNLCHLVYFTQKYTCFTFLLNQCGWRKFLIKDTEKCPLSPREFHQEI